MPVKGIANVPVCFRASTPEESVKWDMEIVKNDPYLPKDLEVVGYVYDVFSGETREVI